MTIWTQFILLRIMRRGGSCQHASRSLDPLLTTKTKTTQKVEANWTYLLFMVINTVITSLCPMKQTRISVSCPKRQAFSFLSQIRFCYQSFQQLTVTSLRPAVRVMQMKVIKAPVWLNHSNSSTENHLSSFQSYLYKCGTVS